MRPGESKKRTTVCLGVLLIVATLAGCSTVGEPWVAGVEMNDTQTHDNKVRVSVETYLGGHYRGGDDSVSIANVSVLFTDSEHRVLYRENVGNLSTTAGYEQSVNATLDQSPQYILLQPGTINDPYNGDYRFEGLKRRGETYDPTVSIQLREKTKFGIFHSTEIACKHEVSCNRLVQNPS